ncbi:hypothetical protein ABBQ32_003237 [Trebouxia sp. C0010 RCD-2024]
MPLLAVDLTRESRGHTHFIRCCVVLIAFSILFSATQGKDIKVGGNAGWAHTASYTDLEAVVGDRLVFEWDGDSQNVVALRKRNCALTGVELATSAGSPAYVSLNYTGTYFFSSSLAGHCPSGQLFAVSVTPINETAGDVTKDQQEQRNNDFQDLIRNGSGYCDAPVQDAADSGLLTAHCYSPPMQLKPGQVEDALYFLPNPFPENKLVGVTKQTLAIVDDTNRSVPLSELYLHHLFGPSDLVTGEGAEFRGYHDAPPLPHPYYTVVNGSHFTSEMSRMVNIHVINTLGVAPGQVQKCIECWCSDERHRLKGENGGGGCCSSALCPSAEPSSTVNTYHLQFSVTYRLLDPSQPVLPVVSYMLDGANGTIEYDIVKQSGQDISTLSLSGPLDARCPQSSSFGLLRCLGHQHIGGRCMRLINQDTGELLCESCPSYGKADRNVPGDEEGYLVKMSEAVRETPLHIQPGTNVTIESDYDASVDHFGVMALLFLDLVDFDESCPGPVTASTGSAFGPDYTHQQGTAFGFYADGFAPDADQELQSEPGATLGVEETVDPASSSISGATAATIVLGGTVAIFGAAGVAALVLRKLRQPQYEPL